MLKKERRVPRSGFLNRTTRKAATTRDFSVRATHNETGKNRYAAVVSTKIDKRATKRHFLKRKILGAAKEWPDASLDIIITALPPAKNLSTEQIREEIKGLALKITEKN